MYLVGIAGKSGSGKTTFARKLKNILTGSLLVEIDKIIEWFRLPSSKIWKICNKRILVESNEEYRYDFLKNRYNNNFSIQELKNRDKDIDDEYKDFDIMDVEVIENTYNEDRMEEDALKISNDIKILLKNI